MTGVQEDDYTTYDPALESFPNGKEIILKTRPHEIRPFGISRHGLYYIKKSLRRVGNFSKLKAKTKRRLLNYLQSAYPYTNVGHTC